MFKGNRIYKVDKNGKKKRILNLIFGLNIHFKGKNSTVTLYEPLPKFSKCKIKLKDSSEVSIGYSHDKVKNLQVIMESNQKLNIGNEFFTYSCDIVYADEENLRVTIGDNCMFARGILIRPSDGHSVIDKDSGELLNAGKNITISNNVWVAGNVAILKGVNIQENCVIGHGSVMTMKQTEANSIYAGNPARLIKQNVEWKNMSPKKYLQEIK